MYYSVAALNFVVPILQTLFYRNLAIGGTFYLAQAFLWILTSVLMLVALKMMKKALDAESRLMANIKEMSLHVTVFFLFSTCILIFVIYYFIVGSNETISSAITEVEILIVCTIANFVAGLILMYIFCRIYIKVKENQNSKNESFLIMIKGLSGDRLSDVNKTHDDYEMKLYDFTEY